MLYRLLPSLAKNHNVTLLANKYSALYGFLSQNSNINLYGFYADSKSAMIKRYPKLAMQLRSIIKVRRIEAIWSPNLLHLFLIFPIVGVSTKIIANHWLVRRGWFYKCLYLFEYAMSDVMVFEYQKQANDIMTYDFFSSNHKNAIIYTGRDFSKFPSLDNLDNRASHSVFTIGMLGQIAERKGVLDTIKAVCNLARQHLLRDYQLRIVGDIPSESHRNYLERIRNEIDRNYMSNVVVFAGWVDNIVAQLKKMDLFLLPSYNEGLSGALREAAAMGIPIVASDVGGNREIVKHGYNGLLVKAGDIDAIGHGIMEIRYNYHKFKANAVSEARNVRGRFSMQSYIDNYNRLLTSI